MKFELPKLPYAYSALEPHIDARTMELHHTKHHATYVAKLNEALEKYPDIAEKPLEELLQNLDAVPEPIRKAVQNHGGGHYNHSLFWTMMKPQTEGGGGEPTGKINDAIIKNFGTFQTFKDQFTAAALGIFGSGWCWLIKNETGMLSILTTANQDTPFMNHKSAIINPILCLDVWEHAYYLTYQNRRADYSTAWWNIVHWERVNEILLPNP